MSFPRSNKKNVCANLVTACAVLQFVGLYIAHGFQISNFPLRTNVVKSSHLVPSSSVSSSSSSLKATWSNGQAIKEYQDFLASGKQEIELRDDGPSVIVSPADINSPMQKVVQAFLKMGNGNDVVVTPGASLPTGLGSSESYPIYVAIPPSELTSFIENLPEDWKGRREDLVFFSGGGDICGCIEGILKRFGYARDSMTQVLMGGFTLPGDPYQPQDLSCNIGLDAQGETKWAGETAVCGKWSGAVKQRLEANDIRCKTGFYREWRRLMWERASYDAIFHLVGAVRKEPTTFKDVSLYYEEEVSDMFWEATGNLRGMLAVTLSYGFEERVFTFAEMRGENTQCELSEDMYPYIFCAPLDQSKMIAEYLNYAKDEMGLLQNTDVPTVSTKISAMRQGNLRADGVI